MGPLGNAIVGAVAAQAIGSMARMLGHSPSLVGGSAVGATTPSDVYSQARQLDAAVQSHNVAVSSHPLPDANYATSWSQFKTTWDAFFTRMGADGGQWAHPLIRTANVLHIKELKSQLDSYWTSFSKLQQAFLAASPGLIYSGVVVDPTPPSGGGNLTLPDVPPWAWIAGGVIVVGVAAVAGSEAHASVKATRQAATKVATAYARGGKR